MVIGKRGSSLVWIGLARTIDPCATIIYKHRRPKVHVIFQRIQIFVTLLLITGCPMAARASEPITVVYGRGPRVAHEPNYGWAKPAGKRRSRSGAAEAGHGNQDRS